MTGLFILLVSLQAMGAPANYRGIKKQINITGPNKELAVGKNRFVIGLDKAASQLHFLDTWNWRVLNPAGSDTVSLSGNAVAMDINQSGDRLYFSYQNGWVKWMDLAPLHTLGFNPELDPTDLHIEPGATVTSGSTVLNRIMAIQDSDSASFDCVFVELKEGDTSSLRGMLVNGNSVEKPSLANLLDKVTNLELAKSQKSLFVKYEDPAGTTHFSGYKCFSLTHSGVVVGDGLTTQISGVFKGIAASGNGNLLIVGDHDSAQLWPYRIQRQADDSLLAALGTLFDLPGSVPVDQIWLTKISGEGANHNLAFFSQGRNLKLWPLRGDSVEFGNTVTPIENFPDAPLILASSSPEDGYIYVAPANSETVSIITANPWISNLATSASEPILTETFKLKFSTNRPNSFFTVLPCTAFSVSPSGCGDELASGQLDGSTANITIASRDLGEGTHILGVFLRDRFAAPFHQGRDALRVNIDLPPPPQQFDLGWGDQRIFIKFKSPDVTDLKKYKIYYGTNCAAGFYKPGHIDASGGNGDPPSPIIIKDPERDHDYEKVVENLVNGTTYCAQIVTGDTAGNQSVSERNSATPEKTKTPSQDAGEKGNISCSVRGPLPPGAPARSDLILLLLPLAAALMLKIKLRSRR